jgi:hypothetical protein
VRCGSFSSCEISLSLFRFLRFLSGFAILLLPPLEAELDQNLFGRRFFLVFQRKAIGQSPAFS